MAQDPDQRPPLWYMARSGFDQLEWTPVLTEQERAELEEWTGNMTMAQYTEWRYWATQRHRYQIFHVLRDQIQYDPRRTPPRVETRNIRARRLALRREPDAVYRIRRQMERELPWLVAQDLADMARWQNPEQDHQAIVEEIRQQAALQREARMEERRQRAAAAQAAYERHYARAQAAWARMRRCQAEMRADEQARARTGESSGSI